MPNQDPSEQAYRNSDCDNGNFRTDEWRSSWYYDYKKYQEEILYSRVNIFLVAVSILAAAYVTVQGPWLRILIGSLGLLSTVLWYLAVDRQQQIVGDLRIQLKDADCLYKEMKKHRDIQDSERWKKASGQNVLFRYLPALFGCFWFIALVLACKAL